MGRESSWRLRGGAAGRRLAIIGLIAVLGAVLAGACGQPSHSTAVPIRTPVPRGISFIGDSLTVGLYATTVNQSYASRLAYFWNANVLDRVGVRGVHANGLLDAIGTMHRTATDVIVEVGTNDFIDTVPGDFDRAYRALVDAVRQREPHARFVCLGLWRTPNERSPSGQGPEVYDALIQADCPGRFVPLQPLLTDPTNRGPAARPTFQGLSDTFHPNDRGHDAIAAAIASSESA